MDEGNYLFNHDENKQESTIDTWIDNDDPCPRCKGVCQNLTSIDDDGYEYNIAERCTKCRWIVRFDTDEEIKAERY